MLPSHERWRQFDNGQSNWVNRRDPCGRLPPGLPAKSFRITYPTPWACLRL